MEILNIDIIDIINNGGFLKCLPSLKRDYFFHCCQIEPMKSATLYTVKIGSFDIEIGIYKKEYNNYEIINLSDNRKDYNNIAINDMYGIMTMNFNNILQSNIIQLLPEYKINHINNIEQIEICFCSGSTIIYQDTDLPPAIILNKLKTPTL
ncbi:hypothetical protein GQ597_04665 [Gilliamella sp. Pra-s65]|uniref:hypothetical protein n=1 Tax=unclassified Gilliamella TaxID=2685620 RepID=UPI001365E649|nr:MULTISPECIES: hypothetical protein [unclassified Gilliamella]MWN90000.1 hypothetical protein [Gilliamella sp. Pra-s65]MWP72874.1 hypothetical protein [Gilliamella sp. Pra-s52]